MRHSNVRVVVALFAVTAFCALATPGCKSEAETAASAQLDKQKEIVQLLKGVTDQASAAAAAPKVKAAMQEFLALAQKTAAAKGDGSKYLADMQKAQGEMQAELLRIAMIPGAGEAIGAAMMGGGPPGGFKLPGPGGK